MLVGRRDPGRQLAPSSLLCDQITVRFKGAVALSKVDLRLDRGTILGLIGPNGAGKTTLLNVLSGYQEPDLGRVLLDECDITDQPPHRRARRRLVRTFQSVRLFGDMTVRENAEVAAAATGSTRRQARQVADRALVAVGLSDAADRLASSLPYGQERLAGIARALATSPCFLLLDEPAAGLNDDESVVLVDVLRDIQREIDCGLLVVEHDMNVIMNLCDVVQVLDHGCTIAVGPPSVVRESPEVITAYLGPAKSSHA